MSDSIEGAGSRASTGVNGLDDVLNGGLERRRLFLIEGEPGAGKTTLALQFLLAGARAGESVLYVTLSETADELRSVCASHGWSLDRVELRELVPHETSLAPDDQNTMFHPAEVELTATLQPVLADVERLKPTRVVFDSLSEVRLLAGSPLRYRRQILALKQFFATRHCTVMLLDDSVGPGQADSDVRSLAHGVIMLEQIAVEYGSERRRLRVVKYRGVKFRGGYHDYLIRTGGIAVFPRLVAAEHRQEAGRAQLSSGIEALDTLMGGGIEAGTSTLLVGAAGTGKSTIAAQFMAAAAARGEPVAAFAFDESPETLLLRCDALRIDLRRGIEAGRVDLRQVDPAELSPGEFVHTIREAVLHRGVKLVVIDSLNGYLHAMPEERFLVVQLHELLMFLGQHGVSTILISAHRGLVGSSSVPSVDASYLADSIVLLRHFESDGEVVQAISVVKKRAGAHERSIRRFSLEPGRMLIGKVLRQHRGVLTGSPESEAQRRRQRRSPR